MQTYELLYITSLQDTDAGRTAIKEQAAKLIQEAGGMVVAVREIARQRLSYPIKKQQAGEYTLVEFNAPGAALRGLERELRLLPMFLRILVTTKLEHVRVLGAEIEAMERAKAEGGGVPKTFATASAPAAAIPPPQVIEDLDKRLEEILGKEMV